MATPPTDPLGHLIRWAERRRAHGGPAVSNVSQTGSQPPDKASWEGDRRGYGGGLSEPSSARGSGVLPGGLILAQNGPYLAVFTVGGHCQMRPSWAPAKVTQEAELTGRVSRWAIPLQAGFPDATRARKRYFLRSDSDKPDKSVKNGQNP